MIKQHSNFCRSLCIFLAFLLFLSTTSNLPVANADSSYSYTLEARSDRIKLDVSEQVLESNVLLYSITISHTVPSSEPYDPGDSIPVTVTISCDYLIDGTHTELVPSVGVVGLGTGTPRLEEGAFINYLMPGSHTSMGKGDSEVFDFELKIPEDIGKQYSLSAEDGILTCWVNLFITTSGGAYYVTQSTEDPGWSAWLSTGPHYDSIETGQLHTIYIKLEEGAHSIIPEETQTEPEKTPEEIPLPSTEEPIAPSVEKPSSPEKPQVEEPWLRGDIMKIEGKAKLSETGIGGTVSEVIGETKLGETPASGSVSSLSGGVGYGISTEDFGADAGASVISGKGRINGFELTIDAGGLGASVHVGTKKIEVGGVMGIGPTITIYPQEIRKWLFG